MKSYWKGRPGKVSDKRERKKRRAIKVSATNTKTGEEVIIKQHIRKPRSNG